MRFLFTARALRDYRNLSSQRRLLFNKQITRLLQSLHYPSLHAKKYDERQDVWQGRLDGSYRFYFQIREDIYVILSIAKHQK